MTRERRGNLRRTVIGLGLAAAACACAWPAQATAPDTYAAPRMVSPITIDGRLEDWPGVRRVVLSGRAQWQPAREGEQYQGPADLAARFRIAWDAAHLYLAVEAYDNHLTPPLEAEHMLQGDCIIVALDANHDRGEGYDEHDSEFGFAYTPGGPLIWRWFPADRAGPLAGAKVAVVREVRPQALEAGAPPIKLTYEVAVPWATLMDRAPAAGTTLGFNIAVNDVDGQRRRGWLQWKPGIMGIKDPSQFGTVVLADPWAEGD